MGWEFDFSTWSKEEEAFWKFWQTQKDPWPGVRSDEFKAWQYKKQKTKKITKKCCLKEI